MAEFERKSPVREGSGARRMLAASMDAHWHLLHTDDFGAKEIEFAEAWDRYAALLQQAGLTRGVFGLDLSFNEDDRRTLPEAERFSPHECVHLYGLAPAAEVEAAVPQLKRLVPATDAVRRPVRSTPFDGDLAAVAYSFKPISSGARPS